jgi:phosphatidylserine/phosphatidylglycerophosphate/cardiolipin synthase-like enzyme
MLKTFLIFVVTIYLSIISPAFADPIRVLFSPEGGCQEAVVGEISKAQKTVDIAMYDLTNREISPELLKAKWNGIGIRVFLDKGEGNGRYSKGRYLMDHGIDVRFYKGTGLMHNKFAVIDDKVLITGSFNWTAGAERENQENLLIITDKNVARQYAQRFEMIWAGSHGKPVRNNSFNVRVSGDVTVSALSRRGF